MYACVCMSVLIAPVFVLFAAHLCVLSVPDEDRRGRLWVNGAYSTQEESLSRGGHVQEEYSDRSRLRSENFASVVSVIVKRPLGLVCLRGDVKIHHRWLQPKCCSIQQLRIAFPL